MPDPNAYDADEKQSFISDCIAARQDEHPNEDVDQSAAVCFSMWAERKAKPSIERRSAQLEIRTRGRRLEGYAATFGVEARVGEFTESIAPGAFAKSLGNDVLALVDHDLGRVLARTKSGSLRLAEDSRGLAFDLDVPGTTVGNDVLALAKRGDLGGMSFGFIATEERWYGDKRTLHAVDLREISVVSAWPAYSQTTVNVRARAARAPDFRRLTLARKFLETL